MSLRGPSAPSLLLSLVRSRITALSFMPHAGLEDRRRRISHNIDKLKRQPPKLFVRKTKEGKSTLAGWPGVVQLARARFEPGGEVPQELRLVHNFVAA